MRKVLYNNFCGSCIFRSESLLSNSTEGLDNRGHYASFIEIMNSKSWLHCNDTAVLRADENKIKNTSSYIYFYESHSFFSLYLFVSGSGFLSLSLGVTTLHATPVLVYFVL